MDLRDQFATTALGALLSNSLLQEKMLSSLTKEEYIHRQAIISYAIADVMMKERCNLSKEDYEERCKLANKLA